jgi:type VI secretion system secreted protein Hcp
MFDAFLNIEGIPGESSDDKHKDWIEISAFSHGISQPAAGSMSTGGGKGRERCNHMEFVIEKELDKASPVKKSTWSTSSPTRWSPPSHR